MQKLVISILFLFSMNAMSASTSVFPDEVSVSEHWISLTKSYEIESNTEILGTVYRRFFSLPLTYDFYDPREIKTVSARARFSSFGVYMDVYDQSDALIGGVREEIFTFYPAFEVLASDSSTILARAEMNFWGTKFYVNDPQTDQEMAVMSRPFFRIKNDWTINFTNKEVLKLRHVDPRVLITVLAVQGEIEYWKKDARNKYRFENDPHPLPIEALSQQINDLKVSQDVTSIAKPKKEGLEAMAEHLDELFKASSLAANVHQMSDEERFEAYTAFCLNLVQSSSVSKNDKKAILTLLTLRLVGHN